MALAMLGHDCAFGLCAVFVFWRSAARLVLRGADVSVLAALLEPLPCGGGGVGVAALVLAAGAERGLTMAPANNFDRCTWSSCSLQGTGAGVVVVVVVLVPRASAGWARAEPGSLLGP